MRKGLFGDGRKKPLYLCSGSSHKPCSYCIGDAHDGRKGCYCLENIMNGKSPCGECVGEILEGNGNKFLAPYFAKAISENTGHEETVKQIISEKYNIPIEKQV